MYGRSHFNLVQPGQNPDRLGHRFRGDHQDRKNHCNYPFPDHVFLLPRAGFFFTTDKTASINRPYSTT